MKAASQACVLHHTRPLSATEAARQGSPERSCSSLLERIRDGDREALGLLYDGTSPAVYGLLLEILNDRAAADEVLLDVYTEVWKRSSRVDPKEESAQAWLLALARGRALDRLQQHQVLLEEAEQLREEARLETRKREELSHIAAALRTPGAVVVPLLGQKAAPQARGEIFWNREDYQGVVTADLPAPPGGKNYQLWFVTAEARRSAGILPVDASGRGFALIAVPEDLEPISAVVVTLEPQGGSEQPTSPISALATF